MTTLLSRVAAAPISWGVCEAPGWGLQLPVDRVLSEARALGITEMEQGALGWLPTDPAAQKAKLSSYGMSLVGGFVPLVLHDRSQRNDALAQARQIASAMAECGGRFFITAVVAAYDRWERLELDADGWRAVLDGLNEVEKITSDHGLVQAVHPHWDTIIETAGDFARFVDGCDVRICFDSGHLSLGGADPVALATTLLHRIGLVHFKDVNMAVATRLAARELTLMGATQAGLFPPLGDGDVPLGDMVAALETGGYNGLYVIEQDVAITDGEPPLDAGPKLGVARGLAHVRSIADRIAAA